MRKIYKAQLLQTSEMQSINYKVNSELIRWEKNELEKERLTERERERPICESWCSGEEEEEEMNGVVSGKTLPIFAVSFR